MRQPLASLETKVLEKMYSKEIENLRFKLLSGALLKDILKQKDKAIQLALLIQKKCCGESVAANFSLEEI